MRRQFLDTNNHAKQVGAKPYIVNPLFLGTFVVSGGLSPFVQFFHRLTSFNVKQGSKSAFYAFSSFGLVPYRLLCLCSFVPGFILSPVYLLKTLLTLCKLFARNFHFKRLYCLNQYFLYLGGYLLTTGKIYGFFAALPTVCSLSHINGKTPALFSGACALLFGRQIDRQ